MPSKLARLALALALGLFFDLAAAFAEPPAETLEPADAELERTVAGLSRVGSCYSPSFSPDGRRLAMVCDLSGLPQVWTVDVRGGWPRQVTALDDQVGGAAYSPTHDHLAFGLAPGGGLNQQIYLVNPDGTGLRRLTEGGRSNNWIAGWTDDGGSLLFSSNRLSPSRLDAYRYDLEEGEIRLLAENPGVGFVTDARPDCGRAVLSRVESRSDANLFALDLESGGEILLTPHEGPASVVGGELGERCRRVYFGSNLGRDRIAWMSVSLADVAGDGDGDAGVGELEVLAARDDAELQAFEIAPGGELAALVWNVAGRGELELVALGGGDDEPRRRAVSVPGEQIGGLTFSPSGDRLALVASGSTRPSDVWILELEGGLEVGERRQVSHSPHAGVDLDALVEPELLTFEAHDGLELSGWLYRPPGVTAKAPFVLSFHGGPESQARPRFRAVYQALLQRGIGVFDPNVRGSSGFGKRFVNLDNGALRFDGIRDIEASVKALVATGAADPERLGIMGGSYGGYMTMAGLAWYPELFAAGANLFGVTNFETFFAHTEPYIAAISKVEYGDPETQADLLRELSPIHRLESVEDPTLVLHGANDTNVPVVEAEQVVESLESRGIPVDYVLFPDEGHGFRKTANRLTADIAIVRWFEKYLKSQPRDAG